MQALVTGGSGFIGRRLCRRLRDAGADTTVLTRNPDGPATLYGDLLDVGSLGRAVREARPEVLFHLASERAAGEDDAEAASRLLRGNGEATYHLLAAARELDPPPRVVYASAMGVYPYHAPHRVPVDESHPTEPTDLYGLSKLIGEQACRFHAARGLPVVALRLSGVYGPGKPKGLVHRSLAAARGGGTVRIPGAEVVRDFVWVDDVVTALRRAAELDGGGFCVYNVGGGGGVSLAQVVASAERAASGSVQVERAPGGTASRFWLDTAAARRDLGYRPLPLQRAMERFLDEWPLETA